ncbi:ATP-dependent RNA helicase [Giardia duodenalis]|uniref:RNA helicase n=2 Tax=Giardia intestinalis TaxID=5741 RepID=E2RTV9_GIAIC|nr:ATP-dependent RNA helicase [Giardia intestinalis]AAK92152.1 DEAD-box RNA helicase [Giardia intestinalis]KAE8301722.1 ATP-dependent RNA helicase [Giardia intestinalis]|eukprot:XP_001704325.1 ATP-dependent RNA helicase [Giardia lamblia ATCC 50803]
MSFSFLSRGAKFSKKDKEQHEPQFYGRAERIHASEFVAIQVSKDVPRVPYTEITDEQERAWCTAQRISRINWGDCGPTCKSFDELSTRFVLQSDQDASSGSFAAKELQKNISKLGWEVPSPVQQAAIPALMSRRDCLCLAPTGSGKSGAYIIPSILSLGQPGSDGFRVLVLVPTRELADQVARVCNQLAPSFRTMLLQRKETVTQSLINSKRHDVMVATPLVLLNFLTEGIVRFPNLQTIVLDEVDCLMNPQFIEQIDAVLEWILKTNANTGGCCPANRPVFTLFSASVTDQVFGLVNTFLVDPVQISVAGAGMPTNTVKQYFMFAGRDRYKMFTLQQAIIEYGKPPVLVFASTSDRVFTIYKELICYVDWPTGYLHAGLTKNQRHEIVTKFRTADLWILVCTDVLARGLDFPRIGLVINFDIPSDLTHYIHRIGRAGRQTEGTAVTLFTERDALLVRSLATAVRDSGQDIPEWMVTLEGFKGAKDTSKAREASMFRARWKADEGIDRIHWSRTKHQKRQVIYSIKGLRYSDSANRNIAGQSDNTDNGKDEHQL